MTTPNDGARDEAGQLTGQKHIVSAETYIQSLEQRVAQLERQLAAAKEWEVVPDGLYEKPNRMLIRVDSAWVMQKDLIFGREDRVLLPNEWRIQRRVVAAASADE